jgi:phosphoglycerate kinase
MEDPKRPLVAVIGGAKIGDKIEILNKFIDMADCVAIGGAMSNNFLKAEKVAIGESLIDKEAVDTAKQILQRAQKAEKERNFSFLLPVDAVVSTDIKGKAPTRVVDISSHSLADIEAYPRVPRLSASQVKASEKILDIGPISAGQIAGAISTASTVIWNGTLGVTETKGINGAAAPFSHGTKTIVDAMIGTSNRHKNRAFSLVGGGDTSAYVEEQGLTSDFGFVSTGGGAGLELMAGHKLPGVEALQDK